MVPLILGSPIDAAVKTLSSWSLNFVSIGLMLIALSQIVSFACSWIVVCCWS